MQESKQTYIRVFVAFVFLAILIGFVVHTYTSPTGIKARQNADIVVLTDAENTSYTTLEGDPTELSESTDAILIVHVWASWSPYTVSEFASLASLKKLYGDTVRIVALNRMEPKETAKAFLSTIQRPEGVEQMLDGNDYFFKSIGGYAMPETLLFDQIGNIQFHKRGVLDVEEFESQLRGLLNE